MKRSAIGTAVAACVFLFGSAPASAHHDMVCTPVPDQLDPPPPPICVAGYRHEVEGILADPPGELREAILGLAPATAGYVPNKVCRPPLPTMPDEGVCVTGLGDVARFFADETGNALEPAICALWTAAGWRCD